jgi:hypothetical protein
MANLDEAYRFLLQAERFHYPIDAITGQTKDGIDAPLT